MANIHTIISHTFFGDTNFSGIAKIKKERERKGGIPLQNLTLKPTLCQSSIFCPKINIFVDITSKIKIGESHLLPKLVYYNGWKFKDNFNVSFLQYLLFGKKLNC